MLTTNMILRDLNSNNQYDAGLALSGLACYKFSASKINKGTPNIYKTLSI